MNKHPFFVMSSDVLIRIIVTPSMYVGWEVTAPVRAELIEHNTQLACSVCKVDLPLSVVIA